MRHSSFLDFCMYMTASQDPLASGLEGNTPPVTSVSVGARIVNTASIALWYPLNHASHALVARKHPSGPYALRRSSVDPSTPCHCRGRLPFHFKLSCCETVSERLADRCRSSMLERARSRPASLPAR